jgi:hypothetical protein
VCCGIIVTINTENYNKYGRYLAVKVFGQQFYSPLPNSSFTPAGLPKFCPLSAKTNRHTTVTHTRTHTKLLQPQPLCFWVVFWLSLLCLFVATHWYTRTVQQSGKEVDWEKLKHLTVVTYRTNVRPFDRDTDELVALTMGVSIRV